MRIASHFHMLRMRCILPAVSACVFLAGCGGGSVEAENTEPVREAAVETAAAGTYDPPEMKWSEFHPEAAQGDTGAAIDTSCVSEG